jgi:hypothetical protein
MTERDFQRANDRSRERLAAMVATLTPTQLSIPLGEGWTVASALAHMGFWDRWQADRWTRMIGGDWTADDGSLIEAEHLANEALHPYWTRAAADAIPELALEAATYLDGLVASAPDALVERFEGTPSAFLLHRHRHRDEHLDHIERSIEAAAGSAVAGFLEANAASRRRLAGIVARLTEADLARPTEPTDEGSWTVAQVLGHIAFWDRSLEARWLMARDETAVGAALEPQYLPPGMSEAINRPLATMLAAWTDRLGLAVAKEAVAAAASLDAVIEELSPHLPAGVTSVSPRIVDRAAHRDQHLDQIERALAD